MKIINPLVSFDLHESSNIERKIHDHIMDLKMFHHRNRILHTQMVVIRSNGHIGYTYSLIPLRPFSGLFLRLQI